MTRHPPTGAAQRPAAESGTAHRGEAPAPSPETQATTPGVGRFAWLAPMLLWPLARPHLPVHAVRPQGGGTQRADDEAMFAAIVYVLVSGVPWRALPKTFTVSWQNTHRRFTQWSEAGLWAYIRKASRAPGTPADTRQWADIIGTLAEKRLNRPQPLPAAERPAQPPRRSEGLKPRIRLHQPGDLTVRLFGPYRPPADPPGQASAERDR
ncbi:transposase [Streptomyces sp. CRN 30]|uniref:transposase n=1 Tax=Streptomyces sp. CRN 30 TaxID=3075613 RepID=UPI002A81ADEC|nr:transposase [Streptomyces sp. CRN 30]